MFVWDLLDLVNIVFREGWNVEFYDFVSALSLSQPKRAVPALLQRRLQSVYFWVWSTIACEQINKILEFLNLEEGANLFTLRAMIQTLKNLQTVPLHDEYYG